MFDPFYPFDWLAQQLVTNLFGLPLESSAGSSLHFFLYDVPKVLTLVLVVSFLVGTLQTFLEPEQVRQWLVGKRTIFGNILAACVGIVTPFCSCSAVPLFMGFLGAGVPLGVTFSYLICAPMVNEVAVILLWGLFGAKIAAIYIGFGVILGITASYILGLFKLEKSLENLAVKAPVTKGVKLLSMSWAERFSQGQYQALEILQAVWIYVVIGIAIGALIHGYIPADLVNRWAGASNPWAVPLAVVLGVPLYANVAGVLPITEALVGKGMPLGTVLAFTMAVTALSLPEMIILRRVLKPKLLAIFVAIVTLGIIGVGYLFNFILRAGI